MTSRFPMVVRGAVLAAALALSVPAIANATSGSVTLVGAGDIAVCGSDTWDSDTAALVQSVLAESADNIAFTAGDNVYPDGSSNYYATCYDPTWGAFMSRTRPVPGNHDYYNNPTGAGYFGYFGSQAGPAGRGWYAFDAGAWRVYALTSECARSSSCYVKQYRWLRSDLVNDPHACVMAIWHRPRFSSGAEHGSSTRMAPVFKLLYDHGAELVISGHDHEYERFAPTDPNGNVDLATGLRQIVVGTGGAYLYHFGTPLAASQVRDSTTHGVLRLDLSAGGYAWQYIPTTTGGFSDSGTGTCH